jgi:hypothetical protein
MTHKTGLGLVLALAFVCACLAPGRGGPGGDEGDDDSAGDDDDSGGTPGFSLTWPASYGFSGAAETSVITFGAVTTGDVATAPLSLHNPGTGALEVCGLSLALLTFDDDELVAETTVESNPEISVAGPESSFVVSAGETWDLMVRFTPLYGLPLDGDLHLVVRHDLNWDCADGQGEGLYVPVSGEGVGDPVPDIYAAPQQVDFGDLVVGGVSGWAEVTIANVGPGQLELDSALLVDGSQFELDAGTLPGSLAMGQSLMVSVRFVPTTAGDHSDQIVVDSNDPDEDPLMVPLLGSGTSDASGDAPVAVCGLDFSALPLTSVSFDGSSSYDPEGSSLTFSWTLATPAGSSASFGVSDVAGPSFALDLAGTYTGTLTATDSSGLTGTCDQSVDVTPTEMIYVELTWSLPDDLDLHLLEANDGTGAQGEPRTDGDCYYANLNPDWGVVGTSSDNPSLLVEDINGTGPELISLPSPALPPYDGYYRVLVHDYTGTVDEPAPNEALVSVYIGGVLADAFVFEMVGEDTDYYVATIHWPTGAVAACSGLSGCP